MTEASQRQPRPFLFSSFPYHTHRIFKNPVHLLEAGNPLVLWNLFFLSFIERVLFTHHTLESDFI